MCGDAHCAVSVVQNPESEASKKKAEADRLRAAEKFLVIGAGSATCEVRVQWQRA